MGIIGFDFAKYTGISMPTLTEKTSLRFKHIRTAHLSENTEDYVELIYELYQQKGVARSVDIAKYLGVSKPTVNKTLARLHKEGFVICQAYHPIALTDKGTELAKYCQARHKVVLDFLLAIGVPKNVAEIDAEGLEHHASPETLQMFEDFVHRQNNTDT